jgi:hypothetical protein
MENQEVLLKNDNFPAEFKSQDLTKLSSFQKWYALKKKENKKIVQCPCCSGYEIYVEPTNHKCKNCSKEYCQKCFKVIVPDEVRHDHERGCCSKFRGLIEDMIDYGGGLEWKEPQLYICTALLFIFGTPFMLTVKYYQFYGDNLIIDSYCTNEFFRICNLFTNIIYCILFNFMYMTIFLIAFIPGIFWPLYFKIIMHNWMEVYEFGIDEIPITELTVRGRGFKYY